MAGRHAQKEKSKAPLIIIIIAAVLVVAAAIAAVFLLINNRQSPLNNTATTSETTLSAVQSASTGAQVAPTVPETQAPKPTTTVQESISESTQETGVSNEHSEIDVVLPIDEDGETSTFDASFIPNGKVIDTETGESVTLREVFGEGFSDAVLTFNSDGTYRDTLEKSGDDAGSYVVQNDKIIATSVRDRNKQITVTDWNGKTPAAFYVDYGGFQVYFG